MLHQSVSPSGGACFRLSVRRRQGCRASAAKAIHVRMEAGEELSMRLRVLAAVFAALVLLPGAVPALAQTTGSATLTGTVVDNVGVVPGATVTATQASTNVPRSVTTNEQGEFRIPGLPPGRYTVKVEMD